MISLKTKHLLLVVHIALTTIWFGSLTVLLFLMLNRVRLSDGSEIAALDWAVFQVHETIIVNVSYGFVYTGLLFSLFTKWGFTKFYWVMLKWLGLLVLGGIVMFGSAPAFNGMAARSDVLRAAVTSDAAYQQYGRSALLFTVLQMLILTGLIVVSVFKPWGQYKRIWIKVSRRVAVALGVILAISVGAAVWMQSSILQSMRQTPVPVVDLTTVPDGVYRGENNFGDFLYMVDVTVQDHRIIQIDLIQNRTDSVYALVAAGTIDKVMQAQNLDVDTVTGATTTSKALLIAIADALTIGADES